MNNRVRTVTYRRRFDTGFVKAMSAEKSAIKKQTLCYHAFHLSHLFKQGEIMDTTGKALVIFGFFFFIGMFSLMWVSLAAGILFILIVGFSAVPATLAIYSHQENKQKEKKLVKHQDGKLVKPDGRFAAQYLGGYAPYPQPKHLMIFSYPDHLEVPELRLTIPYNQLLNVQSLTKEAITAGRMFLVGWYALALKKRYVYLALTFKDAIGIEQNAVFDLYSGHNISVVQPFLYRKMVNARMG